MAEDAIEATDGRLPPLVAPAGTPLPTDTPRPAGTPLPAGTPAPAGMAANRPSLFPLGVLLAAVILALTLATLAVLFLPGIYFVFVAPDIDDLISSAAFVAAGTISVLAWVRFRETGEMDALLQAAAFMVLFVGAGLRIGLLVAGHDVYAGYERMTPGQGPLYAWSLQRLAAALLLLFGAWAVIRPRPGTSGRRALAILIGPTVVVMVLAVGALAFEDALPALVPPATLTRLLQPASEADLSQIGIPLAIVQLIIAGLYLAAALAYARRWARTDHRGYTAFLSVALVVAAFAQVNYAIVPGAYGDLLTSGDPLRLLFYLLVVAGVAAATRGDLRALRQANRELAGLRRADAERIVTEERARFAREVHDGLVQELWLARLTGGRLAEVPRLPHAAKEIAARLDAVLESALGEARQAVVTLQPSQDPSFAALLERFVEDYADRFGMDVSVSMSGDLDALPASAEGDLLRICREALTNARKHANAANVDVRLEASAGVVRLTVRDDGDGFSLARVGPGGYGLESMRQRAQHVGGRLDIASAPGDGTRVTIEVDTRRADR